MFNRADGANFITIAALNAFILIDEKIFYRLNGTVTFASSATNTIFRDKKFFHKSRIKFPCTIVATARPFKFLPTKGE